jgi:hypothetical protein
MFILWIMWNRSVSVDSHRDNEHDYVLDPNALEKI